MCQEISLRFDLIVRDTFSKSTSPNMNKTQDNTALMEISQVFGTLSHAHCQSIFRKGDF